MLKATGAQSNLNQQALDAARNGAQQIASEAQSLRAKTTDILEMGKNDPSARTLRACMNAQFGSTSHLARIVFGSDRIGVRLVGNIVMTRFHLRKAVEYKGRHVAESWNDTDYSYKGVSFQKLSPEDVASVSKAEIMSAIELRLAQYREAGESDAVVRAEQVRSSSLDFDDD